MTPSEQHQLAVELAVWVADQVRRWGAFSASAGGPDLDSATSPFAGACYTLWGLGAAATTDANGHSPADSGHGSPPPHFRLAGEAEARLALAGRIVAPKDFSRLIGEFVGMKEYAPEAFELTGAWFHPSLPMPLLDAFVTAGFLECSRDRCRWLDPMAQWVEWSSPPHVWESQAESEARHLKKYGPIWKSMPPWIRVKVVGHGKVDTLMLPDAIRRFWDGEWQSEQLPDWEDPKRLADAIMIAREITRLVEAGRLSAYRLYPVYRYWKRFERRNDR